MTRYILSSDTYNFKQCNDTVLQSGYLNLLGACINPWSGEKENIQESLKALITLNNIYSVTMQSHNSAIQTLVNIKERHGEGYTLFLRDFTLGAYHTGIAYSDSDKITSHVTLSPEYGDHSILKAIRRCISKPIIGLYNESYLRHYDAVKIDNRGVGSYINALDTLKRSYGTGLPSQLTLLGTEYSNMLRTQEDTWKDTVKTLVESADSIILYVSKLSEGVRWEKDIIKKFNKQQQTIVLFGEEVIKQPDLPDFNHIEKEFVDYLDVIKLTDHYSITTSDTHYLEFDDKLEKVLAKLQEFQTKDKFPCEESIQKVLTHPHFIASRPVYIVPPKKYIERQLLITESVKPIFTEHYRKYAAVIHSVLDIDTSTMQKEDVIKILQQCFLVYSTAAIIEDAAQVMSTTLAIRLLINTHFPAYSVSALEDSIIALDAVLAPVKSESI